VLKHLNPKSIEQYQAEEKTMMTFRLVSSRYRIKELLDIMDDDAISKPEKINQLKEELASHFKNTNYLKARTMGQLLKTHLKQGLRKLLKQVTKTRNKIAD
jgi:small-conductance mechanosensitive channel